jgi:hypothetical protein
MIDSLNKGRDRSERGEVTAGEDGKIDQGKRCHGVLVVGD